MSGGGAGPTRAPELDALRGLAVAGMVIVQAWHVTGIPATVTPGVLDPLRHVLAVVVEGCFLPIFAFLFGLSFSMLADRPWPVLLRRMLALGGLGLIHQVFQPGEALLPYAVAGAVILLPAAGLPRWAVLGAGLAATTGAALLLGDGFGLVPGLFLLGLAAGRFGVVEALRDRAWMPAAAFALALPAAVVAGKWEFRTSYLDLASSAPAIAGLLGALAYATGLLLVLRTGPGALAGELLAPLGRMALTNYLLATALILVAAATLGPSRSNDYAVLLAVSAGIVLVLGGFSALWLRRLSYGPVEWLWRCATWWEWVPMARPRPARAASLGLPNLR
ncbi:DUF418 domain-containing protein [Nocardia sp. NPDC050712]|uniref:DUF418 domain-containing protein n=1 Tax=Nocardia sp. NPDC050712 TaxID=3155518 RepID=UPI0033CF4F73